MKRETEAADYIHRLAQAEALEKAGINPYPAEPPVITHLAVQLVRDYDVLQGSEVSLAGRMLTKRGHGGITFTHVDDASGIVQTVWEQKRLGEKYYLIRDNFEEGDFIGVRGVLGKTKTEEISVFADDIQMLAKALRFPPMTVTSAETQQRQRYLHTLVDESARDRFRVRSKMVQSMREYFINKIGCLEVETPIMDSTYGGAEARPFITTHRALKTDFYLRIANELYLKRYTVGGYYEGVFEFSRDFRNEGMDRIHNPEFTQVELYKPFWDYNNMMEMAENLMSGIVQKVHGTMVIPFGEQMIDYTPPWRRLTIYDGLREKLAVEPKDLTEKQVDKLVHEYAVDEVKDEDLKGRKLVKLFEKIWEEELINPTFVLDFPADTSALTKRHRVDQSLTERFEMYAGCMELMNCYTELNDPRDQRKRFEMELARKKAGDEETMPMDEDFILAQEYGMPQQAGIGISIDRWTMLITNTDHIRQAIYFPTLRPLKS